jgi:hypothetical protein
MKQYGKVIGEVFCDDDEVQGGYIRTEPHSNVIVVTLQELQELWNSGVHHGEEVQKKDVWDKIHSPDFKTYLQSKGITI